MGPTADKKVLESVFHYLLGEYGCWERNLCMREMGDVTTNFIKKQLWMRYKHTPKTMEWRVEESDWWIRGLTKGLCGYANVWTGGKFPFIHCDTSQVDLWVLQDQNKNWWHNAVRSNNSRWKMHLRKLLSRRRHWPQHRIVIERQQHRLKVDDGLIAVDTGELWSCAGKWSVTMRLAEWRMVIVNSALLWR